MDFKFGSTAISAYRRLSYKPWYALAEFVDNSTQSYANNKELLDKVFKNENTCLTVNIEYYYDPKQKDGIIRISDNSIGMSETELDKALTLGDPPAISNGRSKYGLGMKTASFWLGDHWTLVTKKFGEDNEYSIDVDLERISQNDFDLRLKSTSKSKDEHYTVITISKLNRQFVSRTVQKIQDYLRSMYRVDISSGSLNLLFNQEKLQWDQEQWLNQLAIDSNGNKAYKKFVLHIEDKSVRGWAGVLEKGSRSLAGFSILQHDRVIKGWPDAYKPGTIFGYQEGGTNDLINQRLIGELEMNDFDVTHTKDDILYINNELDLLEDQLNTELSELITLAKDPKKNRIIKEITQGELNIAIETLKEELESPKVKNFVEHYKAPERELIEFNNETVADSVIEKMPPALSIGIYDNRIEVYVVNDLLDSDPYVLSEYRNQKNSVSIIINMRHPFIKDLETSSDVLNHFRHSIYDGISEWKAWSDRGEIDPSTIKLIKDQLLRSPFELNELKA
jgi:hypothetical protein